MSYVFVNPIKYFVSSANWSMLTLVCCWSTAGCEIARSDDTAMLFDGQSLSGWTTLDGKPVTRGWQVVDGEIYLMPGKPRVGHIISKRDFGDFRLSFEWKIAAKGNSGLKYRVRNYDGKLLGCEYQILDDPSYGPSLVARKRAGALYDLVEPVPEKHLLPAGQFNSSAIQVENNRITHWLNGKQLLSVAIGSPDWQHRMAESKFNDQCDFALNQRGQIMLTDHGSEVWYRKFELTLLPTSEDNGN